MKKRRLSAILLALALCLPMAAPAQAAEEAPAQLVVAAVQPSKEEDFGAWYAADYAQKHPEEYAAFDANAWFAQEWTYWTKEEYMEAYGIDEAGFKDRMWKDSLSDEISVASATYEVDSYRQEHPGELEKLDSSDLLARLGYLDPMESFMKDMGLTSEEDARTQLLYTYVSIRQRVEKNHEEAQQWRTMAPGSWEAFDADAYFARNYPYMEKGSYMAEAFLLTEEEFREDMYCEYMVYEYMNISVPSPVPGNTTLIVNGEEVDVPITVENGVSYADAETLNAILGTDLTGEKTAVRAAAEQAGWGVSWNRHNNEVVLLDKAKLTRGILPGLEGVTQWDFSRFDAMMNRLLATARVEEGQSYKTVENCEVKLTAFNSLDGDEIYTARVTTEILQRGNVYDMTVTVNAVDLLRMLSRQTMEKLSAQMGKVTFQDLKNLMGGVKLNMILNLEEGMLYWNVPILASFDSTVSADTWCAVDMGTLDSSGEMLKMLAEGSWDTGAFLYDTLLTASGNDWWGASSAYDDFISMSAMMNVLVGPETISESGGTLTWKLDAGVIARMSQALLGYSPEPLEEDALQSVMEIFKEYSVVISVNESGRFTCQAAMRLDMDALAAVVAGGEYWDAGEAAAITWVMNLLDFRLSAQSSGTANQATGNVEVHWKNQFKLEMKTNSIRSAVNTMPRTTPPAGVEIVEL